MLVELGMVEQRYGAVLEVLDEGAAVTDVARRYGWRGRRCTSGWPGMPNHGGLAALADRSSRPVSCPHQMPVAVEARVVWLRRMHPVWGPSRTWSLFWTLVVTNSSSRVSDDAAIAAPVSARLREAAAVSMWRYSGLQRDGDRRLCLLGRKVYLPGGVCLISIYGFGACV